VLIGIEAHLARGSGLRIRGGCGLDPAPLRLPLVAVEDAVVAQWEREVFPTTLVTALRQQLTNELKASNAISEQERRLTERVATVRRERYTWAEKAMEGWYRLTLRASASSSSPSTC
jgi:hypothetical protein